MAGIDTLFKGAVGSLAKDKITNTLTPTQMELASFILNPQYYIAEKGVNKIAEILGYGSDYKNLSADEKSDKAYYKEIMRDTVGDMLPESFGDIVRATPRETEPYDPYNGYFAQNINDWVSTRDSTPEQLNAFENTVRDINYGTQTPGQGQYVGPLPEDNPMFQNRVENLAYDLNSIPTSGIPADLNIENLRNAIGPGGDFVSTRSLSAPTTAAVAPTEYTFDTNIGAVVPATSTESLAPVGSVYDANIGANVPVTENVAPMGYTFDVNTGTVVPADPAADSAPPGYTFDMDTGTVVPTQEMPFEPAYYGGGGGKLENYYYSDYRRGGQIQKGKR